MNKQQKQELFLTTIRIKEKLESDLERIDNLLYRMQETYKKEYGVYWKNE